MSIFSEELTDRLQQQQAEEAYYWFVLNEFVEMVESHGKKQVKHDLSKLMRDFQRNYPNKYHYDNTK